MDKQFLQWLSKQKYGGIRSNTGKYHWAIRHYAIWGWYEITYNDYR
jgi:hypothetical protein